MILASDFVEGAKVTKGRNASATQAFQQSISARDQQGDRPLFDEIKVVVDSVEQVATKKFATFEKVDKFFAKLQILAIKGKHQAKEISCQGPKRSSREEAILDGLELGKAYEAEGRSATSRMSQQLESKTWFETERKAANERDLEGFGSVRSSDGSNPGGPKQPLIPPGEGWTRYDDNILMNAPSQIYFVQLGQKAGQYLKKGKASSGFQEVFAPHIPKQVPLTVRACNSCCVRKGTKLDRAVLLPDIPRIARLALKFPLTFVDLPACAFALFQGHRSAEASQWCAENFHKKLLPLLAEKIHTYETKELEDVLKGTLEALDSELLRAASAYSGCSAMLALSLGDRLIVSGVGHVRAVVFAEKAPPLPLLTCTGALSDAAGDPELERIRKVGGVLRQGLLSTCTEGLDDARRILAASHPFEVLQIEAGGPANEQQVRSAYRKLALRVHPDKAADDVEVRQAAFAKLDDAKEALEQMLSQDAEACREMHRALRGEMHTRAGAADYFGIMDGDSEAAGAEARKICKRICRRLEDKPLRGACYDLALATAEEAVETLSRSCAAEALPRHEALLREGVPTSRLLGARDLRFPCQAALMRPESASLDSLPAGKWHLGLLCGATATLSDEQLASTASSYVGRPKAAALRWCLDADATKSISSAVCVGFEAPRLEPETAPAKRQKTVGAGPEGTVRVRHILFKHQQLRQLDPMARREGVARTAQEAEEAALAALDKLLKDLKDKNAFGRLCRELSDCQSGSQPGVLAGDLGWLGRGEQEQTFDDGVFGLKANEFGDLITTSRGVHVVQRLA